MKRQRKVRKGYLMDINPFCSGLVRHVLVDDFGVFIPSSGWHSTEYIKENYRLEILPKEYDWQDFDFNGWWTTNWKNDLWAWCYARKVPSFKASTFLAMVLRREAIMKKQNKIEILKAKLGYVCGEDIEITRNSPGDGKTRYNFASHGGSQHLYTAVGFADAVTFADGYRLGWQAHSARSGF